MYYVSPLICHGVAGVGCHIDAQPLPVLADKIKRGRVRAGEEAVAVPTDYCLVHEPGKDLKLFTVFDRLRPQLHRAVPRDIHEFRKGDGSAFAAGTETLKSRVISERHIKERVAVQFIENDRIRVLVIVADIELVVQIANVQRLVIRVHRSAAASDRQKVFEIPTVGPPGYLVMALKPV